MATRVETRLSARDETKQAFRSMQRSLDSVNSAFVSVTKVAAGLGAVFSGVFVTNLVQVNSKFQSLEASLITFTGSVANARGAFNVLKEFAKTTPFSLQEVVTSFNILIAQGIRPTEAQLSAFADIAGGTSKSMEAFAEAVADAAVGEFERLKEFGIKAGKEGDKLTLAFGGTTTEINNDADSILAALTEIGATKFAGGAARQADTLGGAIVNLRDTVDEFLFSVGDAGFNGALKDSILLLKKTLSGNEDFAKFISDVLTRGLEILTSTIQLVVSNLSTMFDFLDLVFGVAVIKKIVGVANAVLKFARTIARAQITLAIISTLMKVTKGNLLLLGAAAAVGGVGIAAFNQELLDAIKTVADKIKFTALLETAENALGLELFNVTKEVDGFSKATENSNKSVLENTKTISDFLPAVTSAAVAIKDLGEKSAVTFSDGARSGTKDYFDSISDGAKNAADFTKTAFGSLETTLSDFFASGKLDFGSFTDAIKRGLADIAAKAVITTGLNFLGSLFPSLDFGESGAAVQGLANGGMVAGSGGPKADDILARVSSGEYVIKASSVNKFGSGFFDQLNGGRMPQGDMAVGSDVMENMTGGFRMGGIFGKVQKGLGSGFDSVMKGITTSISSVIGYVSTAVQGLVDGVMSGDLATIAMLASAFILPGVGMGIMGGLGGGATLTAAVTEGIAASFANGVLGAGSLSSIATSVGVELGKSTFTNKLSNSILDKVMGTKQDMLGAGSDYSAGRSQRFSTLYNEASPYLAGMTGTNARAGDNVRVGERGAELFIPQTNGTVAPIKGSASDLISAVHEMKDEIISLRRQLGRAMAGGQLAGARV